MITKENLDLVDKLRFKIKDIDNLLSEIKNYSTLGIVKKSINNDNFYVSEHTSRLFEKYMKDFINECNAKAITELEYNKRILLKELETYVSF